MKTNIKIAFTTENTIAKFLTRKKDYDSNKYKKSDSTNSPAKTVIRNILGKLVDLFKNASRNTLMTLKTNMENQNSHSIS